MSKKILLVEDEELIVEMLQEFLQLMDPGIEIVTAGNLSEARHRLAAETFDVCVCDCRLPDGVAMELFEEGLIKIPIIITTGYVDQEKIEAIRQKATAPVQVLPKPYQPKDLYNLLQIYFKEDKQNQNASKA